jgi:multiple sugar transport system ATP-binding protein
MRGELRELHETLHSTTVYVTHDQEEAMTLGDRVVVMKDGVAQQIGSASEIYHNPANRFVAGFLGSPSMNFLDGQLVKEGDRLYFDEGTGNLPVPPAAAQKLEPHIGRDVVHGVRPELLSDAQHARFETDGNQLQMQVRQVQMLGDCLHVYLATDKHKNLIASVDGYAQFRAKESVPVYVDMTRSLFFSANGSGERLSGPVV